MFISFISLWDVDVNDKNGNEMRTENKHMSVDVGWILIIRILFLALNKYQAEEKRLIQSSKIQKSDYDLWNAVRWNGSLV